jgi:predicted DNA-binding transcriptional regulator YafY
MLGGRSLDILYMSTTGETARRIDPLYPTEHNGIYYLVAYCHLRREQRTFRLDRIFSAQLVD